MSYLEIADYGVIGDLRTIALVGRNGSIDWCCLPRFDSASIFGAIVDDRRGGRFRVSVAGSDLGRQEYVTGTAVLRTRFTGPHGTAELRDFMPVPEAGPTLIGWPEIHRQIRCTAGTVDVEVRFDPAFDYAVNPPRVERRRYGVLATDGVDDVVGLSTSEPLDWSIATTGAAARLRLAEGESLALVMRHDDDDVRAFADYKTDDALAQTQAFWRNWVSRIQYHGAYRDAVERSAITLKLMCYARTGAIVAAPTTSLPEVLGGSRNWDYRYAWLRDACFALYSFHRLGQYEEADHFMYFVKRVSRLKGAPHLQIMFGIDGRRELPERELGHLEGYRNSRPVRIGNGAVGQLQLDVYGEVLETAYRWSKVYEVTEGTWAVLRELVDWVAENWRRRDSGIWEPRTELCHYVFSKVMCWVALDRGARIAETHRLDGDVARWRREAEACHAEVMEHGFDAARGTFVQAYGSHDLDAAALVIPMVRFLRRDDPRVHSTVRAIASALGVGDDLVYRYRSDDGLAGSEGAFSLCSFWLAEAYAMIGEYGRGVELFERMLKRANHVGLYSEQIDAATGSFLGNFPQGLTHIALINCADVLARLDPSAPSD